MTILVTGYASKKELKEAIGQKLKYQETSMFGEEFKANGTFSVAHRPAMGVNPKGREFFASVTMENSLIKKVD